jgi:hypothetical protein
MYGRRRRTAEDVMGMVAVDAEGRDDTDTTAWRHDGGGMRRGEVVNLSHQREWYENADNMNLKRNPTLPRSTPAKTRYHSERVREFAAGTRPECPKTMVVRVRRFSLVCLPCVMNG